jgi:hypothetical protein
MNGYSSTKKAFYTPYGLESMTEAELDDHENRIKSSINRAEDDLRWYWNRFGEIMRERGSRSRRKRSQRDGA